AGPAAGAQPRALPQDEGKGGAPQAPPAGPAEAAAAGPAKAIASDRRQRSAAPAAAAGPAEAAAAESRWPARRSWRATGRALRRSKRQSKTGGPRAARLAP